MLLPGSCCRRGAARPSYREASASPGGSGGSTGSEDEDGEEEEEESPQQARPRRATRAAAAGRQEQQSGRARPRRAAAAGPKKYCDQPVDGEEEGGWVEGLRDRVRGWEWSQGSRMLLAESLPVEQGPGECGAWQQPERACLLVGLCMQQQFCTARCGCRPRGWPTRLLLHDAPGLP